MIAPHIVIPMAGLSRRFAEAGYQKPKYMLEVGGRSLFRLSLLSFRSFFRDSQFTLIYRDVAGTDTFVRRELETLGLRTANLVMLDAPTQGQAETVEFGLAGNSGHGGPLLIFNIDTIRPGYRLPDSIDVRAPGGYLEVTRLAGDNWSFAEPAADHLHVIRTAEKARISDLCSTGIYYFRSNELFVGALQKERARLAELSVPRELYVAPLYNHLIEDGEAVLYHEADPNDVLFSGTPSEYDLLLNSAALRARLPIDM